MDERFVKAMEDFITGRINDWGFVSSKAVAEAAEQAEAQGKRRWCIPYRRRSAITAK